jgi:RNA polymerase sigma-70 factor, ECF subfamily
VQTLTDREVIEQIRHGNEQVFGRVFYDHAENLVRYAATILKDTDDAEDIVQQLFVAIWDKRNIPDVTTSLKSYLYRSVYNSSLNKLKQQKVKESYATYAEYVNDGLTAGANAFVEQKETALIIEKAINELPEQCRLVFTMSRMEQLKYQEIADKLGISIKTVENQMGKALRHMRERLKDYILLLIALGLYIN